MPLQPACAVVNRRPAVANSAPQFIKFKGFDNSPYPGGPVTGRAQNGSFTVPTCDWYANATNEPRCSGFFHDQEQVRHR